MCLDELESIARLSTEAIVNAHAQDGAIIERPAIDAVHRPGLTTQITAKPTYRTNLFRRNLNIADKRSD